MESIVKHSVYRMDNATNVMRRQEKSCAEMDISVKTV